VRAVQYSTRQSLNIESIASWPIGLVLGAVVALISLSGMIKAQTDIAKKEQAFKLGRPRDHLRSRDRRP
jgi:hypothetical protein